MSDLSDTFEALCRAKNAVRKVRESGQRQKRDAAIAMFAANFNSSHGPVLLAGCPTCGCETFNETWRELHTDGIVREHLRCQVCGTERAI